MRRISGGRFLLLGALVAFVVPSPSNAQGIGVGAKIGPLFSNLVFSDSLGAVDGSFERRTGWMGGVFVGGNLPGLLGVGAELNVRRTASRAALTSEDVDLTSISVPVYLRVTGGSRSRSGVSGYFIVGPGFDINLEAKAGGDDISRQTKDFELNLNIGGGVEVSGFIVELRYIRGLTNIADDPDLDVSEAIKTNGLALLFGVRFN